MDIVTRFRSNFVVLTVWAGHPNFYSISQLTKKNGKWAYIPFLREADDKDLFEVIRQYKEWSEADKPKREWTENNG